MDNLVIGVQIPAGQGIFLFSKTSRDLLVWGRIISSWRRPYTLWVVSWSFLFCKTPRPTLGYVEEFYLLQDTQTHSWLRRRILSSPRHL